MAEINLRGKLRQKHDKIAVNEGAGVFDDLYGRITALEDADLDTRVTALEGSDYDVVLLKIVGTGTGGALQAGDYGLGVAPRGGEIVDAFAFAPAATTATITVSKAAFSAYDNDTFSSVGSFDIAAAKKAAATLTGWTKTISRGDILKAAVSGDGESLSGSVLYVALVIGPAAA